MPINFLITSIGLEDQDRLVVNTATKLLSHDGVAYQLLENQPGRAHLLILDDETSAGKLALKQSRPGQVKLVVSSKPAAGKNAIGIPRPVELSFLKSVLKKLYLKLQAQAVNQEQVQQTRNSETRTDTLQGTLFNILLDAREKQEILQIRDRDIPAVFVDGRNHCLATTASEQDINRLIDADPAGFSILRMNPESFAVHSNELSIQSLYNLLWLAGIKCARGRLLPGHRLDTPIRLRAWPNFTRNSFIASHLKLAAVLAKRTMSMNQLAELTQVPLADVINFYNAAYAVELIEYCDNADQTTVVEQPRNLARQGLLAKIAKRLNFKGMF